MNELKARGVEDVLIAEGFPEADRGRLSADRGSDLHRSSDPQFAGFCVLERPEARRRRAAQNLPRRRRRGRRKALEAFENSPWGRKYAAIGQIWRRQWEQIVPFFAFAPAVRKIIYTTNAIEALNAKLRRAVRPFP